MALNLLRQLPGAPWHRRPRIGVVVLFGRSRYADWAKTLRPACPVGRDEPSASSPTSVADQQRHDCRLVRNELLGESRKPRRPLDDNLVALGPDAQALLSGAMEEGQDVHLSASSSSESASSGDVPFVLSTLEESAAFSQVTPVRTVWT